MSERKFISASPSEPCSVCGRPDDCSRSANGPEVFCRRVCRPGARERADKNGRPFYIYVAEGAESPARPVDLPDEAAQKPVDAALCHEVYTALLARCPLSQAHRDQLRARELSDQEIEGHGYATLPADPDVRARIIADFKSEFGEDRLTEVPGFFRPAQGAPVELAGAAGLLVRVCDADARTVRLRIRLDHPPTDRNGKVRHKYVWVSAPDGDDIIGTKSGAPIHVPLRASAREREGTVAITEGEIKANIATARTGVLTVSLPGVSMIGDLLAVLDQLGARHVVTRFDADIHTNPAVAAAHLRLLDRLFEKFDLDAIAVETWPIEAGKGVDDVLAAGRGAEIKTHRGADALAIALKFAQSSGAPPHATIAAREVLARAEADLAERPANAFGNAIVSAAAELQLGGAKREYRALVERLRKKIAIRQWEKDVRERAKVVEAERLRASRDPAENWKFEKLETDRKGEFKRTTANVIAAIKYAPAWEGVLAVDEFAHKVVLQKPAPWHAEYTPVGDERVGAWTDGDDARLNVWVERELGYSITPNQARSCVTIAAEHAFPFHPVRDYLSGLVWDGVLRLATFFVRYFGSPQSPEYLRLAATMFFIGAVARIFEPGCKHDYVPVLEGDQGKRKTSAVMTIAKYASWFAGLNTDIGEKDALIALNGKWIVELSELAAMRRGEVEKTKAFLTECTDTYRPPYGRRAEDVPRQCVFIATTNADSYLIDTTGNRRFWPVRCERIDHEALAADVDQIWAEAVHRFRANERRYPLEEEEQLFVAEQSARVQRDPWCDVLGTQLENAAADFCTAYEILTELLGFPPSKVDRALESRLGHVMKELGWERTRPSDPDGRRVWGYRRPMASAQRSTRRI